MFDDPRRQHCSRISKVILKADARQSESSRINILSREKTEDVKGADTFLRVWTKIMDCPAG